MRHSASIHHVSLLTDEKKPDSQSAAQRAWAVPDLRLLIQQYAAPESAPFWLTLRHHTFEKVVKTTWRNAPLSAYLEAAHSGVAEVRDIFDSAWDVRRFGRKNAHTRHLTGQSMLSTYSQSIEILQLDGATPYSDVAEYEDASVLFDMMPNLDRLGQAEYGIDTGLKYVEAINDMPETEPPLPFWRPVGRNGKRWRYCVTIHTGSVSEMRAAERAQPYASEPLWRLILSTCIPWRSGELEAVADMLETWASVQENGDIKPIPELHLRQICPSATELRETLRRIHAIGTAVHIEFAIDPFDPPMYNANALWFVAKEYTASWTARHTIYLMGHLSNLRPEVAGPLPSPPQHLPYGVIDRVKVDIVLFEQPPDSPHFPPLASPLAYQLREALQKHAASLGHRAARSWQLGAGVHWIVAAVRLFISAEGKKMLFETAECILREEIDKAKLLARAEYLRTLH